jgi:Spy/CpxP family protein refolding chaperone
MKKVRRIVVAMLMGTMLSVGVFAQKNDNRPPKEQPKVVDKEKGQKPPPSNNNQSNNKPRKP